MTELLATELLVLGESWGIRENYRSKTAIFFCACYPLPPQDFDLENVLTYFPNKLVEKPSFEFKIHTCLKLHIHLHIIGSFRYTAM